MSIQVYLNYFNNRYQDKEKYIEKIDEIKSNKNSSGYDSIIGLSGGVDSSYLCLYAKSNGLNTKKFILITDANSDLAQKNIELIVNELEFDLYTHVVDWDEFKNYANHTLLACGGCRGSNRPKPFTFFLT